MGTRESGWFRDIVNALTCELCTLFFSFLKILFIYLTERETAREREHKQGEWERKKQAHSRAGSLMQGSIPGPQDHALSRRQTLND